MKYRSEPLPAEVWQRRFMVLLAREHSELPIDERIRVTESWHRSSGWMTPIDAFAVYRHHVQDRPPRDTPAPGSEPIRLALQALYLVRIRDAPNYRELQAIVFEAAVNRLVDPCLKGWLTPAVAVAQELLASRDRAFLARARAVTTGLVEIAARPVPTSQDAWRGRHPIR